MTLRIFTDIDDTLMSTGRKTNPSEISKVGAVSKNGGQPSSYISSHQDEILQMLLKTATDIVPVSARSEDAYKRLTLKLTSGAVLNFGQTILKPDNSLDEDWHAQMVDAAISTTDSEMLRELKDVVTANFPDDVMALEHRVTRDLDTFLNIRAMGLAWTRLEQTVYDFLKENALENRFYVHRTDRDITVLPVYVRKGKAVKYLLDKNGWSGDTLVGAGDSLVDTCFMQHMSFALLPTNSRAFTYLLQGAQMYGEAQ
ncbi:hypothetical protein LC612_32970 [Nostoc sp. CHAB 5834]|nr:hypothetical protein [Nostoc sp. CHAB 5834]